MTDLAQRDDPPQSPLSVESATLLNAPSAEPTEETSGGFDALASPYTPVIVLGPDGFVKHMTKAARGLLQYRPDQDFDDYFFTHVHGKNLPRVMRDLAAMVKRGSERASWLLRLRTGRDRWRWYRAEVTNRLSLTTPAVTVSLRDLHSW
jgi:hypothetical protein